MQGLYGIINVPQAFGHGAAEVAQALIKGAKAAMAEVPKDWVLPEKFGLCAIQLRAKSATTAERIALAKNLGGLCEDAGVPLLMNDDIEAACAGIRGVRGVHLGQEDLQQQLVVENQTDGQEPWAGELVLNPRRANFVAKLRQRLIAAGIADPMIGISTHTLEQLRAACRTNPDYVAYGPVFSTRSKAHHENPVGMKGLLHAARLATRPLVAIGGLDAKTGAHALEAGTSAAAMISALQQPTLGETENHSARTLLELAAASRLRTLEEVRELVPVMSADLLSDLVAWSDQVGTHIEFGLPARFAPIQRDGVVYFRPGDVVDLLYAFDKQPEETWDMWQSRNLASGLYKRLVALKKR